VRHPCVLREEEMLRAVKQELTWQESRKSKRRRKSKSKATRRTEQRAKGERDRLRDRRASRASWSSGERAVGGDI